MVITSLPSPPILITANRRASLLSPLALVPLTLLPVLPTGAVALIPVAMLAPVNVPPVERCADPLDEAVTFPPVLILGLSTTLDIGPPGPIDPVAADV